MLKTCILFVVLIVLPAKAFTQEAECVDYSVEFPNGDLSAFATEFFRSSDWSQSALELEIYNQIEGHRNPFVSLMASYKQIENTDYAAALFNLDFAEYLFRKENLCGHQIILELQIAAKMEIFSRMNEEIGDDYSRYAFSLLKNNSTLPAIHFEDYLCVIKQLNWPVSANDYRGCYDE